MVTYTILPEHRIIIEIADKTITVDDYILLKIQEANDALFNPQYNFIVDLRKADYSSKSFEQQMHEYITHVKSIPNLFNTRKSAFITQTPEQVVAMTFYKLLSDLPIHIEIFSTIQSALQWLAISSITSEKIEHIIQQKMGTN